MKIDKLGYIALFRQFIDWEWFTDVNTCHLYVYCLLRANFQDTTWQGIPLKKGQFVTSLSNLSIATGLTVRQVRTCLNRLKSTNQIAIKTSTQNSIITVINYDEFQTKKRKTTRMSVPQTTTDNNRDINKYINISLSNKSAESEKKEKVSLSEREREILKKFSKREGAKNVNAYIRKLIDSGDYLEILEEEKRKIEQRKLQQAEFLAEKSEEPQNISKEEMDEAVRQARLQVQKIREKRT